MLAPSCVASDRRTRSRRDVRRRWQVLATHCSFSAEKPSQAAENASFSDHQPMRRRTHVLPAAGMCSCPLSHGACVGLFARMSQIMGSEGAAKEHQQYQVDKSING